MAEYFYLRAIEDDLRVYADGKYYDLRAGQGIAVKKTTNSMRSFGADVKNKLFELINEETYKMLEKRKKVANEINRSELIEEFEKMIENVK